MQTTIAQRNALIEQHLNFVRHTAYRISKKMPPGSPHAAELVADGVLGLIDAIESFDPARGIKLASYALLRIRGAMLDAIRGDDHISRLQRGRQKQYAAARQETEQESGRRPTDEEIADALGLPVAKFRELWAANLESYRVPLEQRVYDADAGRVVVRRDLLPDESAAPPETRLQKSDLLGLVTKGLTREERLIVILYYYEQMTMKQIGATLGLSESRVSQMHSALVEFLRERLRERKDEFV